MSISECPNCDENIEDVLRTHFYETEYPNEFEFTCPKCKVKLRVEVGQTPFFDAFFDDELAQKKMDAVEKDSSD